MFISFQKILPIGIQLLEILRPKHGQKTQKTPKTGQIAHFCPILENIFFRNLDGIDLSEFILYDSYGLGLHRACWVILRPSSISKVIRVLVKKVDFLAFFSVSCYINPILGRIYRSNYQKIMHKSYFYVFPQKKLRKKIFFLKKNFFVNPIFLIFRYISPFSNLN